MLMVTLSGCFRQPGRMRHSRNKRGAIFINLHFMEGLKVKKNQGKKTEVKKKVVSETRNNYEKSSNPLQRHKAGGHSSNYIEFLPL